MREFWRKSKIRKRLLKFLSGLPWPSTILPDVPQQPEPEPQVMTIKKDPTPPGLWTVDPKRVKEAQQKADQQPEEPPE